MADKQYKVLLLQRDWANTEVFDISAKDAKTAEAEAKKLVDSKDLKDAEWKLEVREASGEAETTAQTPAAPSEPEER
jgi:hypothetical protein